jgi:hypothetical protein
MQRHPCDAPLVRNVQEATHANLEVVHRGNLGADPAEARQMETRSIQAAVRPAKSAGRLHHVLRGRMTCHALQKCNDHAAFCNVMSGERTRVTAPDTHSPGRCRAPWRLLQAGRRSPRSGISREHLFLAALPLHRDAGGVANLDPHRARTGSIGAVDPLRHGCPRPQAGQLYVGTMQRQSRRAQCLGIEQEGFRGRSAAFCPCTDRRTRQRDLDCCVSTT